MIRIPITRNIRIPDPVRPELNRRSPELGPRILFFGGNSDPESIGPNINDRIKVLLQYLHRHDCEPVENSKLLNFVLLDEKDDLYPGRMNGARLHETGIRVIRGRPTSSASTPCIDEKIPVPVLLSLS